MNNSFSTYYRALETAIKKLDKTNPVVYERGLSLLLTAYWPRDVLEILAMEYPLLLTVPPARLK